MSRNVRNAILTVIVDVVFIIAYVLIALILVTDRTTAFWVIFGSTVAVIASQVMFYPLVIKEKDGLVFAIPALRVGYSTTLLQWLFTWFYITKADIIDGKYFIVGQIAILAVYIALEIFAIAGMSFAKDVEKAAVKNNNVSSVWALNGKIILDALKGTDYEKKAMNLFEELKYSNPKSFDNMKEVEDSISASVISIKDCVQSGSISNIESMLDDCIAKVKERNELCKLNK